MNTAAEAKGSTEVNGEMAIAEFDALRREIEVHIAERRKIESQVIIGVAVLYSWVFTRGGAFPEYLFKASLGIAPVLTFLGFVRWSAIHLRTMKIGEYLCSEKFKMMLGNDNWESFLEINRKKRPIFGQLEGWSEFLAWLILFCATLVVLGMLPAPLQSLPEN